MKTIEWLHGRVRFLDQTLLPESESYTETDDYRVIAEAIRSLRIRGAPLIGIAAAYGVALAAHTDAASTGARGSRGSRGAGGTGEAIRVLAATRPTAVNLFRALDRMARAVAGPAQGRADRALAEALAIHREDGETCAAIGKHGAALIPDPAVVVTHCNAGALATGGIGTALGVLISAAAAGKRLRVFAGETRPLFQGSRLTAWELSRAGIDVTVVTDASIPWLMSRSGIDAVIIGADRIAANGDVANKIGSYGLARAAADHGLPFYVAAPATTIDGSMASGAEIPIEERPAAEVTEWAGAAIAPRGIPAWTPAFDVTPARYVTAIITEDGVHRPPYRFGRSPGEAPEGTVT